MFALANDNRFRNMNQNLQLSLWWWISSQYNHQVFIQSLSLLFLKVWVTQRVQSISNVMQKIFQQSLEIVAVEPLVRAYNFIRIKLAHDLKCGKLMWITSKLLWYDYIRSTFIHWNALIVVWSLVTYAEHHTFPLQIVLYDLIWFDSLQYVIIRFTIV